MGDRFTLVQKTLFPRCTRYKNEHALITKRWISKVLHAKETLHCHDSVGFGHQDKAWCWCLVVGPVSGFWVWCLVWRLVWGFGLGLVVLCLVCLGLAPALACHREGSWPRDFPIFQKERLGRGSFWRLPEGLRPQDFPTLP